MQPNAILLTTYSVVNGDKKVFRSRLASGEVFLVFIRTERMFSRVGSQRFAEPTAPSGKVF